MPWENTLATGVSWGALYGLMPVGVSKSPWYNISQTSEKVGEIRIYGIITSFKWFEDDVTPHSFQEELDALGPLDLLNVYINTPGGEVFAGMALCNIIKRNAAKTITAVDGIAASMGAVVLQSGDERTTANNGMVMVHNPMSCMCGYASDFRKAAVDLDKVREAVLASFIDRVNVSKNALGKLLDAETLMTADEALRDGFVDRIEPGVQASVVVKDQHVVINGVEMVFNRDAGYRNIDSSKFTAADSIPAPEPSTPPAPPAPPAPLAPPAPPTPEPSASDCAALLREVEQEENEIFLIDV